MASVRRDAAVGIEEAAALAGIHVATLQAWIAEGSLVVDGEGDARTVLLADVDDLAARWSARTRSARRASIRSLLREAPPALPVDVTDLQRLVRERAE